MRCVYFLFVSPLVYYLERSFENFILSPLWLGEPGEGALFLRERFQSIKKETATLDVTMVTIKATEL